MRFAEYRQYEQVRIEASNAVMGLLAGAQMAAHMLQLTEGSDRLLPEMFPQIPHIGRLNLTTEAARGILADGDIHLGAMAVPYALAIHEDYLKTCLTLLQRGGISLTRPPGDLKLAVQHEEIERATGKSFTPASLEQAHVLRLMRNCTIHSGGQVSSALLSRLATWSADAETGWVKLTGRSPRTLAAGDTVTFGHGEVLIALAVTKARSDHPAKKQRFASRPGNGALCEDDFHPLDDGAPDVGVTHGGDPVAALVDGHVGRVFIVELDARAGSEQEDKPGPVILGQAAGCQVERVEGVLG